GGCVGAYRRGNVVYPCAHGGTVCARGGGGVCSARGHGTSGAGDRGDAVGAGVFAAVEALAGPGIQWVDACGGRTGGDLLGWCVRAAGGVRSPATLGRWLLRGGG